MSQIKYRANLNDSDFPFVSTFQGKTVIQQTIDQNSSQGALFDKGYNDKGIPEAYYMHNVVPSTHGYKSVGYSPIISATDHTDLFSNVFAIKDFSGNRGLLGITEDGETYLATNYNPQWVNVTPTDQPADAYVTVANATGTSFVCYSEFGIFTVDLVGISLVPANLQWDAGMSNEQVLSISSSNNYLLAHTATTLYWSAALDVLDFRESQITGAGNGTPTAVVGSIITVAPVGVGFAVYCQGNIVVATFSGNVQYPWIFKEAPNGSGIANVYSISRTGDELSNYAWTSAGLLKVTLSGCSAVFPEATDFLAGKIFEDYNSTTDELTTEYTTLALKVKLAFVSSRFLVISYGKISYTHALVYDTALKRWGKLKLPHVQVIDMTFKLSGGTNPTYQELGLRTYLDFYYTPYTAMNGQAPIATDAKESFAMVQLDGTVQSVDFEYGVYNTDAVLFLGKYQLFRLNTLAIQEFTFETIDSNNTNFTTRVLTSIDGKNTYATVTPYEEVADNLRTYYCLTIGYNHTLRIKGGFHLVGVVITFSKNGNR